MPVFETAFGVPAGHSLRLVRTAQSNMDRTARGWEHEEYDGDGILVAVYESWVREDGGLAYIKYSPFGWVLSLSGRSPHLPPRRTLARQAKAA